MTVYRVLLERGAENHLARLSSGIHDRVTASIQALATNPRPPGCRKLAGSKHDWRIRVGNYRGANLSHSAERLDVLQQSLERNGLDAGSHLERVAPRMHDIQTIQA